MVVPLMATRQYALFSKMGKKLNLKVIILKKSEYMYVFFLYFIPFLFIKNDRLLKFTLNENRHAKFIQTISLLVRTWQHIEPGHQQPCY